MRHASRRQLCFPAGTKYVLEGRGPFVRRYIEFPNGGRIQLLTRKAQTCVCTKLKTNVAPEHNVDAFNIQSSHRRIVA
jgi:hypothetical protein